MQNRAKPVNFRSSAVWNVSVYSFLKKYFIYLFLERGEGREKERERNINVWLPLHAPHWGSGLQPRHVP